MGHTLSTNFESVNTNYHPTAQAEIHTIDGKFSSEYFDLRIVEKFELVQKLSMKKSIRFWFTVRTAVDSCSSNDIGHLGICSVRREQVTCYMFEKIVKIVVEVRAKILLLFPRVSCRSSSESIELLVDFPSDIHIRLFGCRLPVDTPA